MRFRQPAPVRIGRWPCRLDAVDFDRSPHAGVVLVGDHASRVYLSWERAANFLCRNASDFACCATMSRRVGASYGRARLSVENSGCVARAAGGRGVGGDVSGAGRGVYVPFTAKAASLTYGPN